MIDTKIIDDIMAKYPQFHYETFRMGDNVALHITKKEKKPEEPGARQIQKILTQDDDINNLEIVLLVKE